MKIFNVLFLGIALTCLSACASYDRAMGRLGSLVYESETEKALDYIKSKKVLKKQRNRVLYNLERGTLARQLGDVTESTKLLNQADFNVEDYRKRIGQQALAFISNPMSLPYKTEYFENVSIHYMKTLNFLVEGNAASARVEARRMDIALNRLKDNVPNKKSKYHDDVLARITMGLAYEANGEWNNAFIAYRNAVDLFLDGKGSLKNYQGISMPNQLACDLLRAAKKMNMGGEYARYKKLLNPNCIEDTTRDEGELVVFWENGLAPVKKQVVINLGLSKTGLGGLSVYHSGLDVESTMTAEELNQFNNVDITQDNISLALPTYQPRPKILRSGALKVNGKPYRFQQIQSLNTIAPQALRDRYAKELAMAVMRMLAKRGVQEAISSIDFSSNKEDKDDDSEAKGRSEAEEAEEKEEEKKKENNNTPDATAEALGQLINVVNTLSERADTRGWQTLPAEVSYIRIPIRKGQNNINIELFNAANQKVVNQTLKVQSGNKLQFAFITTPNNKIVNSITSQKIQL